jgi:hypothetical protein
MSKNNLWNDWNLELHIEIWTVWKKSSLDKFWRPAILVEDGDKREVFGRSQRAWQGHTNTTREAFVQIPITETKMAQWVKIICEMTVI